MTEIKKDKNLLDLPVLIYDRDMAAGKDEISSIYLKELGGVSTPDELREFCKRWRNIWLLKWPGEDDLEANILLPEEVAVVEDAFDAEKVLEALGKKDDDEWLLQAIDTDENAKVMMQIAVPLPLLSASVQSRHWGVGSDLIMVRLFLDPYPELNEACRYGSGDIRKNNETKSE